LALFVPDPIAVFASMGRSTAIRETGLHGWDGYLFFADGIFRTDGGRGAGGQTSSSTRAP
jgi:hypothetical protein